MAPVLQCPECGTKHPLAGVSDRSVFPCTGCGRTLKVPEQVRAAAPDAAATAEPVSRPTTATDDPDSTRAISTPVPPLASAGGAVPPPRSSPVPGPPLGVASSSPTQRIERSSEAVPPRSVRFALWFLAVPLGFVIVFGAARAIGVLDSNQISDVWLAEGWDRLLPIARLLPFVALVTAGFVHGGVVGITKLRKLRHPTPPSIDDAPGAHPLMPPVSAGRGS